MKMLQRWFNLPPFPEADYITDRYGKKYWIDWTTHFGLGPKLIVYYYGKFIGTVETSWKDDGGLELNDIIIFNRYKLRGRGLGKAMMKCFIEEMQRQGEKYIEGFIQPDEGTSTEYLVEWYQRVGFFVYEGNPGKYLVRLNLQTE